MQPKYIFISFWVPQGGMHDYCPIKKDVIPIGYRFRPPFFDN